MEKVLSQQATLKLQLYFAAQYLFNKGYSYPQIIEILIEHAPDENLLKQILDKAVNDEWEKLYVEAHAMASNGVTYDEVRNEISKKEKDIEIVDYICEYWYELKIAYAESVTEGNTNVAEGMQWVLISIVFIVGAFALGGSLILKIISIVLFVVSGLQWFIGRRMKQNAETIEKFFEVSPENSKTISQ